MALPKTGTLKIGHDWLKPLFSWLDAVSYIVNALFGLAWYPLRAMTAAPLPANTWTLATNTKVANAAGALTVDGVAMQLADRFWDKDDAVGLRRGAYVVLDPGSASTPWKVQRTPDANTSGAFVAGKKLAIGEGATNGGKQFALNAGFVTLNTDTPAVTQVSTIDTTAALTITGAWSFAASALRVWNGASTFATRFTSGATATRVVNFPDAAGDVLLEAATQDVSGAKSFLTLMLKLWNAGKTFATSFQTNATAARTLTFPDASGIVLTSANTITLPFTGKNGAGAIAVVGTKVGDVVYSLTEIGGGTPTDGRADFEAIITVNDQIQQLSVADLSMTPCIGYAARP